MTELAFFKLVGVLSLEFLNWTKDLDLTPEDVEKVLARIPWYEMPPQVELKDLIYMFLKYKLFHTAIEVFKNRDTREILNAVDEILEELPDVPTKKAVEQAEVELIRKLSEVIV